MSESPERTDPFFTLDGEPQWNACVGRQSDEEAYADGYIEAAILLVNALIDGAMMGSRDTLVMPILYNGRHAIELSLKSAVRRLYGLGLVTDPPSMDHDIIALWRHLGERWLPDEALRTIVASLRPFALSLGKVDEGGQDFRYAQRADGQLSMPDHALVNLKRVRNSLTELKEQLDHLQWRVLGLQREYHTGSFTAECSRRDLTMIATLLPPRSGWHHEAFNTAKSIIRERFQLSSNAFSKALDRIQNSRELGAAIGLEFNLAHLTDAKVMHVLELWSPLFPLRDRPSDRPLTIQPRLTFEEMQTARVAHETANNAILPELNADELADLEAVFYLGRDHDFGEEYDAVLARIKHEHAAHGNAYEELNHLTSKGNLATMLAVGAARLGRRSLSNHIRAWRPDLF